MRKWSLIVSPGLAALLLVTGCSKGDVCDPCESNDDCKDGLDCYPLETEWRCADSPWQECLTKSHLTAP